MAYIPDQQFAIDITGTASVAVDIFEDEANLPSNLQVIMYSDIDVVVKMGDSSVVADETVTSSKLTRTNHFLPAGAIMIYGLSDIQKHISGIAADGLTIGTLYISRGLGENI